MLNKLFTSVWLFDQPHARLFYINIITALVLAFIFVKRKSWKEKVSALFNKELWLHPSAVVDYKLYFFNAFFKVLLIAPWMITSFTISVYFMKGMFWLFPDYEAPRLGMQTLLVIFTILSFVINDFFRFYMHYLMHMNSFLWKFHRTHHSAEVLTPVSLYRAHPVEVILAQVRNALAAGLSAGLFTFFFQKQVGGLDILGVNIIGFLFNLCGSNLRHSHIWIGFGPLEYIFISPAQHQIHHAKDKKYYDTNFGIVLSIWDWMFKTCVLSKGNEVSEFGVEGTKEQTLKSELLRPFI
jgi:sterol desaturase/sphingolipid hydroxylase (fatty acid hydroxylase superfamily)